MNGMRLGMLLTRLTKITKMDRIRQAIRHHHPEMMTITETADEQVY